MNAPLDSLRVETVGVARVAWLIGSLSLRRFLNRVSSLWQKRGGGGARRATGRKPVAGRLLLGFLAVFFVFQATMQTTLVIHRAARVAEQASDPSAAFVDPATLELLGDASRSGSCRGVGEEDDSDVSIAFRHEARRFRDPVAELRRIEELRRLFDESCARHFRPSKLPEAAFFPDPKLWFVARDTHAMPKALALVTLLLTLAAVFQTIVGLGRDFASPDSRFEWFFSFPVPARSIFLARIAANALVAPWIWALIFPFYAAVFWCAGYGLFGLPLAAAAALYVGALAGSLRVVAETALPHVLSARNLTRLQAMMTLSSSLFFLSAIAVAYAPSLDGAMQWSLDLPTAVLYTPGLVPLLASEHVATAVLALVSGLGFVALMAAGAISIAERAIRGGLTPGAGAHQGARGGANRSESTTLLRGMALKECRALFRDRQLRTQAFVGPIMFVAFQVLLNPSMLQSLSSSPRYVATAAFGTAMFAVLTGAFQALAIETGGLWTLYTFPVALERQLGAKLWVWCGIAMAFASLVFIGLWCRTPSLVWLTLPHVPLVFIGIYLYSVIALCIGALGTDPFEAEPRKRIRLGTAYLFMVLASLFGIAIYSSSLWTKFAELVLSSLLAYALWQKLRDQLPFLLDPTAAPPASIAVADGILAALGFFVFQGVFVLALSFFGGSAARSILLAFSFAGATVTLSTLWIFHQSNVHDLFRVLGLRKPASGWGVGAKGVMAGVVTGLVAGSLALAYQSLIQRVPVLRELRDETLNFRFDELEGSGRLWFAALAVIAAPVFEEFIFRGVLYGGFRRSLGAPISVLASSVVFALVHPAISAFPVFVMACLAAFVYEHFRWLGAPMATHATYNAVVVGASLWVG